MHYYDSDSVYDLEQNALSEYLSNSNNFIYISGEWNVWQCAI